MDEKTNSYVYLETMEESTRQDLKCLENLESTTRKHGNSQTQEKAIGEYPIAQYSKLLL